MPDTTRLERTLGDPLRRRIFDTPRVRSSITETLSARKKYLEAMKGTEMFIDPRRLREGVLALIEKAVDGAGIAKAHNAATCAGSNPQADQTAHLRAKSLRHRALDPYRDSLKNLITAGVESANELLQQARRDESEFFSRHGLSSEPTGLSRRCENIVRELRQMATDMDEHRNRCMSSPPSSNYGCNVLAYFDIS